MVIWITGASTGLGRELALQYASLHHTLILSSRNQEKLQHIEYECVVNGASTVRIVPINLSNPQSITEAFEKVQVEFGFVDLLINNAGIGQRGFAYDTPVEIDQQIMDVNFWGHVRLTKLLLPMMIQKQKGHIAVVSSMSGLYGFYQRSAYCAAKHALNGFYESLALEIAEFNISVSIICPGRMQNSFSENALTSSGELYKAIDKAHIHGIPVTEAARKIIKKLSKRKRLILIGKGELLLYYIKRLSPALFFSVAKLVKNK